MENCLPRIIHASLQPKATSNWNIRVTKYGTQSNRNRNLKLKPCPWDYLIIWALGGERRRWRAALTLDGKCRCYLLIEYLTIRHVKTISDLNHSPGGYRFLPVRESPPDAQLDWLLTSTLLYYCTYNLPYGSLDMIEIRSVNCDDHVLDLYDSQSEHQQKLTNLLTYTFQTIHGCWSLLVGIKRRKEESSHDHGWMSVSVYVAASFHLKVRTSVTRALK